MAVVSGPNGTAAYHQRSAQRIAIRCVLGWYRWDAKRRGLPPPIIHTYEPERGPDGKLQAKPGTLRPMTDAEIEAL